MSITGQIKRIGAAQFTNWLIIGLVLFAIFNTSYWNKKDEVIKWDVISYYAYLPATFIYHDPSLKFIDGYQGNHKFIFWPGKAPNGGKVIKTSMGLSVLYAPFFITGHLLALLLGYDTGGFSMPYKFMLMMSAVFYFCMGLFFLRKVLSLYFSPLVVILTTLGLVLGTNLFWYASYEATMPHVYNFSLIAVFIYLTIRWFQTPGLKHTVLIGLLSGLIALIRPTNIIILVFFICYGLGSFHTLRDRLAFFLKNYRSILFMAILFILVWTPQFIYWKKITGHWMFFSYGNERFFFNHPQIIRGLFGYRKGWLIYAPVMSLALLGIPILYYKLRDYFWPVLIFTVLNIYIILSWWSWWYGGCFGQRAFIDSYPILALPLAVTIQWMLNRAWYKKAAFGILFFALVSLGAWHTVRYYYGSIHWDSMCKKAYWSYFFRAKPDGHFYKMLEHPDDHKAKHGIQAIKP